MTPEEAYERGQRDMRNRIERQWRYWITNTLTGHHRSMRPKRKGYSNVSIMIRQENKIQRLTT